MIDSSSASDPKAPPETDAAVAGWMGNQGWTVPPARWHLDPDGGFFVWQEQAKAGGSHALWVSEGMVDHLSSEQLVKALHSEDVANEIRISLKIRIQERGDGFRVSVVSRRSGEWEKPE